MSLAGEPRARWGAMNDPMLGPTCPVNACIFVNLRGKEAVAHADGSRLTVYESVYTARSREAASQPLWSCEAAE